MLKLETVEPAASGIWVFLQGDSYKCGWARGFYGCAAEASADGISQGDGYSEFAKGYRHGLIERTRRLKLTEG